MKYDDFEKEIYGEKKDIYIDELNNYGSLEKLAGSKVRGSLLWMTFGLIITAIIGFNFIKFISNNPLLSNYFETIIYVSFGLQLLTVIGFTGLSYKVSANILKTMFLFYSALTGINLSVILLVYEFESIVYALVGTIVLFAVLAIYGYVTKEDLSKYGSMLRAGLIAVIVMGLINIFLKSESIMWISSMMAMVIFIIFTAYDINRIKNNVIEYALTEDKSILDKIEIFGALSLYLDFINLFLYILRFFGKKK